MCSGVIKALGKDENHALVDFREMGEIEVPRHHIKVQRPAGRKTRVVVIKGEHLGKVGVVESKAVKYGGKWRVIEHVTKAELIIHPTDLASVYRFPGQTLLD
jgi:ribosomal protein S4E